MYDYLIVGAGLFGATFARLMTDAGCKCLVIDRRDHIAGNVYTERVGGINVHRYGAHIFHTNDREVWDFVNRYAVFNRFTNSPVANFKGELYSLPFNMYTFNRMWGVTTPEEAKEKIAEQRKEITGTPGNLEEQAISLVGRDIYEKLIKGYTEKQWGRKCSELPAFIIKRLPVRYTFDNNYFNALYQGIPTGGYTKLVANLLDGIETVLGTDYLKEKDKYDTMADTVIYTGAIDEYFGYRLGCLEYRSVRFENEILDIPNFQGNAAVNYTDAETPWTRIIEHKWFEFGKDENGEDIPTTVISREYSAEWKPGDEPYYPVNDEKNTALYAAYLRLASENGALTPGGTDTKSEKGLFTPDVTDSKSENGSHTPGGTDSKSENGPLTPDATDPKPAQAQVPPIHNPRVRFGGRLGQYKYYDMDQVIRAAIDMAEEELKAGHINRL